MVSNTWRVCARACKQACVCVGRRAAAVAEAIGVTAEPEVLAMELTPAHPFMVLASDGVWEFMPSQEVVTAVRGGMLWGAVSGRLQACLSCGAQQRGGLWGCVGPCPAWRWLLGPACAM